MMLTLVGALGVEAARRPAVTAADLDVTIHGPRKLVGETIANTYSGGGYTAKTVNDFALVFEKPDPSAVAGILFGSRMAGTPNVRVTMSLSDAPTGTRVISRMEMVSNPGSGMEKVTDLSGAASGVVATLKEIQAVFDAGVIGIMVDEGRKVTMVVPEGPAAVVGIKTGDVIEAVNGVAISTRAAAAVATRGDVGSVAEVKVTRGKDTLLFRPTRAAYADVYGKR